MTTCTRCSRTLTRPPVFVGGMPYGSTCARLMALARDPLEFDLFTGIDLDGAVLVAMQRVLQVIEDAAARHLAQMRAAWGAT